MEIVSLKILWGSHGENVVNLLPEWLAWRVHGDS